jgi:hypothetical protein
MEEGETGESITLEEWCRMNWQPLCRPWLVVVCVHLFSLVTKDTLVEAGNETVCAARATWRLLRKV